MFRGMHKGKQKDYIIVRKEKKEETSGVCGGLYFPKWTKLIGLIGCVRKHYWGLENKNFICNESLYIRLHVPQKARTLHISVSWNYHMNQPQLCIIILLILP